MNENDNDPTPRYDLVDSNRHGTRCAGEVRHGTRCAGEVRHGTRCAGEVRPIRLSKYDRN